MIQNKKGFTLIELLAVVAVIAILVAIVIPSVMKTGDRANAAADAANLKTALGEVNVQLLGDRTMTEITENMEPIQCKTAPGARLLINYVKPVGIYAYFVDGNDFYSVEYLAEVAATGSSKQPLTRPNSVGFWFGAGEGKVDIYNINQGNKGF